MGSFIKQRSPVDGETVLGLEKHGYVMFPDAETEVEIPYVNNQFKLGLTKKEQKEFEDYFGYDFESEEGKEFLGNYRIKISHTVNPFDETNMERKFVAKILRANDGLGLVDINSTQDVTRYPFVLVDEEQEMELKTNRNITRNEAITQLQNLKNLNPKKLVRISKYLFDLNVEVTENQAYNQVNDYIMGTFENARLFLTSLSLDEEWLDTYVTVKDARNTGIIRKGEDQVYVNHANGAKLGRTLEEVTKFLNNPDNADILGTGGKNDTPYSIKYQLKHKLTN